MTFGSFGKSIVMLVRHSGHKHADAPNAPRLLRARRQRPGGQCAAEDADEIAASHVRRTRQPRFEHSTAPWDRDADAGLSMGRGDSPAAGPSPA
jgi:hypothetical protein